MTLRRIGFDSPVGRLQLVASDAALVAVWLPGLGDASQGELANAGRAHPVLDRTRRQLDEYFAGARTSFDLPLDPSGTEFQRTVWRALVEIPCGETRSYGAIAARIGRPSSVRAVGAANGKNPIAILVPCHRVIGADGSLTGYAGGLPCKQRLLEHEGFHVRARERRRSRPGRPGGATPQLELCR